MKTAQVNAPKVRKSAEKVSKRSQLVEEIKGLKLLGEIITWTPGGSVAYKDVVQALQDAGLELLAKELTPRSAFSRAAKSLSEERIIDVLREDTDEVVFQFSKRKTVSNGDGDEFEYKKETKLFLNKATGIVKSKDEDIQARAQEAINRMMSTRTAGDITMLVQKLFENNADLFAIRDRGGAYFVPSQHSSFVVKVQDFLHRLGGKLNRFPVPAGTQIGDAAVQDTVAEGIKRIISDHNEAVDGFTVTTHKGSIEDAADRIKNTRIKVEAYASYLSDKAAELLKSLEQANTVLVSKIATLDEERKTVIPRDGSAVGAAFAVLSKTEGKTMNEIMEEAKLTSPIYGYIKRWIEEGRVIKDGKKFRLA